MSYFAGLLTFILVVNCLMLILLILVQLPKKDAGAGLAFGGGTADALFGAGSGNALTKITKWATVVFLLLSLFLGYLQDSAHNQNNAADFTKKVQEKQMQAPAPAPAPAAQPAAQTAPPATATPTATIPAGISGAAATATNSAK
ncbi:MAG TPA: preprotein translocase subunit SecG [Candidatus Acidoferrales bacterium]|jgi:preprotein translocase subunit SecG|nr:preprotein translocase subunit SecG [Candidatus Acidoferrales bacterium]